jgi:hypothetical protein
LKNLFSIQYLYHFSSALPGSYFEGMSIAVSQYLICKTECKNIIFPADLADWPRKIGENLCIGYDLSGI